MGTGQGTIEHPASVARRHIVNRWKIQFPKYGVELDNAGTLDVAKEKTAWCRVTVVPSETDQASMGGNSRLFRDRGVVIVQLFVKQNEGTGLLEELSSFVRELLQGRTVDGVVFRTTSVARIGLSGSWMQYNASTGYFYDYSM